jgi:large subunit ribosomal protein L32
MAVPKKRTSKQRKRKRRTHHKAESPMLISCPRCGDPKRPHRVCSSCGTYRNQQVIEVEDIE